MVLIAPAIDITGYWWAKLSEAEQQTALAERRVHLKTQYQAGKQMLRRFDVPQLFGVSLMLTRANLCTLLE